MANITFGERVRRTRVLNGLTQADLGAKFGVTQATICNWETGKIAPNKAQKQKLSEILGRLTAEQKIENDESPASDGLAPLSLWLAKSRIESKLSVLELAGLAGISSQAIYNIESGKILNPREDTVKRLEKALGKSISKEAKDVIRDEANIDGVGELIDFDPHSDDDRPAVAGIYVFYDISQRPIYVGQGGDIRSRIRDHKDKFWFRQPIVENAAYVRIADKMLREKVETLLIRFLKSNAVINKQHVERTDADK